MGARLILCPTPIGNLEDITLRALSVLRGADVVLCEDTRRTRLLLRHYGIDRPLLSYHKWNEKARLAEILGFFAEGKTVALVSDAGSPLLADPGEELVQAAIGAGVPVEALPGPQAVVPALTASGLPTLPFYVEGFLPKGEGALRERLGELAFLRATLVFFESPERVGTTLKVMHEVFGERRAALVRELTKVHEEVVRGTLASLAERLSGGAVRGEIVLVVEGAKEALLGSPEEFVDRAQRLGVPPRRALSLGVSLGFPRRVLYDLLLKGAGGTDA